MFDRESRFIKENWERTPERDSKGGTLLITTNLKLTITFICECVCVRVQAHICIVMSGRMCEGQRTSCWSFYLVGRGDWALSVRMEAKCLHHLSHSTCSHLSFKNGQTSPILQSHLKQEIKIKLVLYFTNVFCICLVISYTHACNIYECMYCIYI